MNPTTKNMLRMLDGSGSTENIDADDLQDACEQARDWVRDGDWGEVTDTLWLDAAVEQNGEQIAQVTVSIDPKVPNCPEHKEHAWADDGEPVGHGGGVICLEKCRHCGLVKRTDTWAQRPDTGEQGLTSVSYR